VVQPGVSRALFMARGFGPGRKRILLARQVAMETRLTDFSGD